MILQSLNDLYERLSQSPEYQVTKPGYSTQKISFSIVIHLDGRLHDFNDERHVDEKGKRLTTPVQVLGDAKPSGAGINPGTLWDNQTYMLGRQPEDKQDGFGKDRFEAFRAHHLSLEQSINSPRFSAVCRFLESWNPEDLSMHEKLLEFGTGFGVFQIIGEKGFVHDDPIVVSWWETTQTGESDGHVGQCLITGLTAKIARLHPKIKGIAGAQSAGASLVSFNDSAYESYSKSQSYNSPVGEVAAFQYGAALNSLLTGPMSRKHRLRIGDTTCVFWTEIPTLVEDCLADLFGSGSNILLEVQDPGQRNRIERLLNAIRSGGRFSEFMDDDKGTPFYILGLAPNAARLSIRFFYRSDLSELLENLEQHHNHFRIVREFIEPIGKRLPDPVFPSIWQILRETARVSDEIPPLLGGALARSILEGTPYPEGLYSAVIRRIHLDRQVNYLRAATLKAILSRNHNINMKPALDKEHPSPAYHLGRLFAVFEQSQRQAHEFNLDRTIRESHFGSASATPASVFARLHRLHVHHLRKLSPGSQKYFEDWTSEICQKFSTETDRPAAYPTTLNLMEQGIFSIGYYHQMHEMRRKDKATETSESTPEFLTLESN